MRLQQLLLVVALAAAATSASRAETMLGASCATVTPGDNGACCQTKAQSNDNSDAYCTENYPDLFQPLGSSCATVTPGDNEACCQGKAQSNDNSDAYCTENYPNLFKPLGSSCAPVTPGYNEACCRGKAQSNDDSDAYCTENYPNLFKPPGSSCGTVSPDSQKACCQTKADNGDYTDSYCEQNYLELFDCEQAPTGERRKCCRQKIEANMESSQFCKDTWPELYNAPLGSSCATVTPGANEACCQVKVDEDQVDSWCEDNFPELYSGNVTGGNFESYPWMAYIESPLAPNGSCGGSLVAPGYVLTAAQCVFKDGQAAAPADVEVWVDGQKHEVELVLVDTDNAQFAEFQNPKTENSWDIAMLALKEDSQAPYVALPLADVPKNGDWLNTTAWAEPKTTVETAMVPAWDGCPPGWADEFCAGGSGFLQACPNDKGSPALSGNTQVGLASGPGCDGTSSDYGYFVKLSNKQILEQITVWLNHRGTTGLDSNIQSWLIEANTYMYGK